ncbi:hypothetical protein MNBD_CHLOROFLEXI01-1110 [hydrothermal vent metagenome]|uniref:Uncharacterized protein n=1 Tax=hydrothermal vent metagenome TaxID=652676 RepID=A0A3B0VAQ8_9ZZZZ
MHRQVSRLCWLITVITIFLGVSCGTSTPVEITRRVDESMIVSVSTGDPTSWPNQPISTLAPNPTMMPTLTVAFELLPTTGPNPTSMATSTAGSDSSSIEGELTNYEISYESTSTPIPNPTSTVASDSFVITESSIIEGWLTYQSAFYNYEISYPQDAKLRRYGVSGFPTEEQPENMTFEQYLTQLRQTYPEDICITISYKHGTVSIMAPPENGGKYGDCVGYGVGAYDLIEQTENIIVDGVDYLAEGFEIREQNEAATWHGEILSFRLNDGTLINLSGTIDNSASYDEYMNTREVLLQIIMSYHKN